MSYLHDQTLEDFVNHEHSRLAQLMRTHVISLRMHTGVLTAAAPACMAPRLGSSSDPIGPIGPFGMLLSATLVLLWLPCQAHRVVTFPYQRPGTPPPPTRASTSRFAACGVDKTSGQTSGQTSGPRLASKHPSSAPYI